MFSRKVEYALRTAVYLASEPQARTVEQVSQATRVEPTYLAKVVQNLVRAGVLRSQRGVGGGVALVKAPTELTLLEVVNAVEPIQRIRTCPLDLAAHGVRLCPLHARLDRALAGIEEAFARTTLAELLADPNPSVPLCDGPRRRLPLA
jgi:Rrf2 family protein